MGSTLYLLGETMPTTNTSEYFSDTYGGTTTTGTSTATYMGRPLRHPHLRGDKIDPYRNMVRVDFPIMMNWKKRYEQEREKEKPKRRTLAALFG